MTHFYPFMKVGWLLGKPDPGSCTLEQRSAQLRSVGELVRHIALGPIERFRRMPAPGSEQIHSQIEAWEEDLHRNHYHC
jgi:hypothetical protein